MSNSTSSDNQQCLDPESISRFYNTTGHATVIMAATFTVYGIFIAITLLTMHFLLYVFSINSLANYNNLQIAGHTEFKTSTHSFYHRHGRGVNVDIIRYVSPLF